ncbi:MAG: hypothetical protein AABY22_22330 [Nanoarchaeota archaeon]
MERYRVLIEKDEQSMDLSQNNLVFIFENLRPPIEQGIHLYKTPNEENLFVLDEWVADATLSTYTPSKTFLELEKQLKSSSHNYYGFFHNHNYTDKKNDMENKLLILPSNEDIWNNKVPYIGIVRNFRMFSDLRIFLNNIYTDYPYPPRYFVTINTPAGNGTRVIKSKAKFSVKDEKRIEFEDTTGYIENSILRQSMI